MIKKIVEGSGASEFVIYLSGTDNYRIDVATIKPYKGNRDPNHRPVYEHQLHNYMVDKYNAIVVNGMEADDAMGIEQVSADRFVRENYTDRCRPVDFTNTIICTIDKDLDMIPGWHYNWKRDDKYFVTEDQAMRFFYTQLLTGDPTDNIQGVPGVGIKKADKLLECAETEEDMYGICKKAYADYVYSRCDETRNLEEKAMSIIIENARLVWISRTKADDWRIPNEE